MSRASFEEKPASSLTYLLQTPNTPHVTIVHKVNVLVQCPFVLISALLALCFSSQGRLDFVIGIWHRLLNAYAKKDGCLRECKGLQLVPKWSVLISLPFSKYAEQLISVLINSSNACSHLPSQTLDCPISYLIPPGCNTTYEEYSKIIGGCKRVLMRTLVRPCLDICTCSWPLRPWSDHSPLPVSKASLSRSLMQNSGDIINDNSFGSQAYLYWLIQQGKEKNSHGKKMINMAVPSFAAIWEA